MNTSQTPTIQDKVIVEVFEMNANRATRIGAFQIGLESLPAHGERLKDATGHLWRVRMNGGFVLREIESPCCHPEFTEPMSALAFACWWNNQIQ